MAKRKLNYNWYAEFKYAPGMYLCIQDGDAESGMCKPEAYIGYKPTYFRTEKALRSWTRQWIRGSFRIKHREEVKND